MITSQCSAGSLCAQDAASDTYRCGGLIGTHPGLIGHRGGRTLYTLAGVKGSARLETGLENSVIIAGEVRATRLADVALLFR